MVEFEHRDSLPTGFLDAEAADLHHLLPGPTLIDLPGTGGDTVFVSVLQHGNEDTGLRACQRLLADYAGHPLPRPLSLFVGNPLAAREGRRRLDDQPDLNRSWPGGEAEPNAVTAMLARLVERVHHRPLFASVDIHNTSGRNPVYAGVNVLDGACLQLARLFSRNVVYFTRPLGLQAQAFLPLCPAVVLECGRPGDEVGIEAARAFLDHLLRRDHLPAAPPAADDIDLLASVGVVHVAPDVRFGFGTTDPDAEVVFDADIDLLNFRELPAGTEFARARTRHCPLRVVDPAGNDATAEFFELRGNSLRLRRSVVPSLLTLDPRIVRQDCLCHLMEAFPPQARSVA